MYHIYADYFTSINSALPMIIIINSILQIRQYMCKYIK